MSLLKKTPANPFQPTSVRQRRWILAAAVAAAALMWGLLLFRPGAHPRVFPPAADRPACSASQRTDCVGGKADVMLIPAAPASAPR